jgi:hypothetical protein
MFAKNRSLTVAAPIRAATVRERFPAYTDISAACIMARVYPTWNA